MADAGKGVRRGLGLAVREHREGDGLKPAPVQGAVEEGGQEGHRLFLKACAEIVHGYLRLEAMVEVFLQVAVMAFLGVAGKAR
jgi:hypothetical protein